MDSDGSLQVKTVEAAGKESGLFDVHEARLFGLALVVALAILGLLVAETIPASASIPAPIRTSPTSVVYIVVPELVGTSSSRAAGDLTSLGLQVSTILADSNVAVRGQVIGQNPSNGEALLAGSTVTLTVSNGTASAGR